MPAILFHSDPTLSQGGAVEEVKDVGCHPFGKEVLDFMTHKIIRRSHRIGLSLGRLKMHLQFFNVVDFECAQLTFRLNLPVCMMEIVTCLAEIKEYNDVRVPCTTVWAGVGCWFWNLWIESSKRNELPCVGRWCLIIILVYLGVSKNMWKPPKSSHLFIGFGTTIFTIHFGGWAHPPLFLGWHLDFLDFQVFEVNLWMDDDDDGGGGGGGDGGGGDDD